MGEKPKTELLGALRTLYQTRDYSDLVVFARDGSRYPVHRAIVCPRSHFFFNAVKERRWRNSNEGHVALSEDEPDVVQHLIEYLYLLDYEPIDTPSEDFSTHGDSSDTMSIRTDAAAYGNVYGTSAVSAFGGPAHGHSQYPFSTKFRNRTESTLTVHALPTGDFPGAFGTTPGQRRHRSSRGLASVPPDPSPLATNEPHLLLHARMYAAGHTYGIDGLKALALDKFKIQLTRHWDSPEFAEAIHVVYNITPSSDKEMREVVADCLGWHSRLLDKPEIECAIIDINGLAFELLKQSRRAQLVYMD